MTNSRPLFSHLLAFAAISYFTFCSGNLTDDVMSLHIATKLNRDRFSIRKASNDYGNLVHETPSAVFHPSSVDDIVELIKFSNNRSTPFTISARGRAHSVRGQAMARDGVVVDMASLSQNGVVGIKISWDPFLGHYADAGGESLWVDVLRVALDHGLAPVSWTDYLYLTVGGTLSNAGISGQSFLYGPQINNVHELDVVTGKGDFVTCSKHVNSRLFFAVLGGLGQFGIITRARIVLQKAPTRAKWLRLVYTEFSTFTRDQEHLISTATINTAGPNYVEGSLVTNLRPPNNWRSSFFSLSHHSKITSLLETNKGLLYSIEVVKYYDDQSADTIDQEVEKLVNGLSFVPGYMFMKDVEWVDFLGRVGSTRDDDDDDNTQSISSSSNIIIRRPWLNLFVPRSRIMDFNAGVLVDIIAGRNQTSGPILFYPFHTNKWDDRMSAVIPNEEEIFYTLGLLHSSGAHDDEEELDVLNDGIMEYCERAGIPIKQYLPHYKSKEDWAKHFGPKWGPFQDAKIMFDPNMILSPGQRIFSSASISNM